MMSRSFGALAASLSAAALLLASNDSFARPAGAAPQGIATAATPSGPVARPPMAAGARFRGRNTPWVYWPGGGGFFYDNAGYNQPLVDAGQPASTDIRYTYTYDVPWDWTHRFPPNVVPSDRPYVPSCPTEQVTVPGRGGVEHTVNVMRCY
ncbi:hypothetical protein JQ554_29235 [Bradyrhizobium diazoefficiens]|nr:hypothetical protein [Bradyrhizobium diazoefficiens]MBR0968180.1 hypothetical protein [Bradyrhizobium diazoefficiens]MBR0981577.1 hypothetical protein [Bradyrhizobium diazoefficiens]MBR1011030.1 hypothetical protein [Bradyrhizobium diazoefficiens]MBR1017530.1 hypothetical protein [Bradyrhizobium diazoefficiens]MBR1054927.1 hypothetical protein [Bradyrhizobium diazoefficiens]